MSTFGPNVIVDFADNTVTDMSAIGDETVKQNVILPRVRTTPLHLLWKGENIC